MKKSFYQYTLSHRGGPKTDDKAVFAEAMFNDLSFPKYENTFDKLSRYVEETADDDMRSIVFDELFELYKAYTGEVD